jgi:hypothetical protein
MVVAGAVSLHSLLSLGGCGLVRIVSAEEASICDRLRSDQYGMTGTLRDPSVEDRVYDVSCPNRRGPDELYSRVASFDVEAAAQAHDDRKPLDPLVAAFSARALLGNRGTEWIERGTQGRGLEKNYGAYLFGWARLFVEQTDVGAVAAAASKVPVSDYARRAFVEQYAKDREAFLEKVASARAKGGAIAVELEAPLRVFAARKEYYATHKDLYERLDRLVPELDAARTRGEAPAAMVSELEAIRSEYIKRCPTEGCTYDPLYIDVTFQLATLHLNAKDGARSKAETMLLTRTGSRRGRFVSAVDSEREKRYFELEQAEAAARKKKALGLDQVPDVAASKGKAPAPRWTGKDSYPDFAEVLQSEFHIDSAIVEKVAVNGAKAKVVFKKQFSTWTDSNCVETGRIRRIHADGYIEYDKVCTPGASHTVAHKIPDPIDVPANEAKAIKPGEHLSFAVRKGSSEAFVIDVRTREDRSETIVQVRGDRLGARKP